MRRSLLMWFIIAVVYLGFRLWYDGGGGPLAADEVQKYIGFMTERGADPARIEQVRAFLANDTGSDFVMANFIRFQDTPNAQEELDRYMAHMYPALAKRACHPIFAGPVVSSALDYWGLENGDRWSLVGLVRYRSRRDMMEIATDPAFADAHKFKSAAMAQTIAIPVQPFLQLGSPRWLLAAALVTIGAMLQLALRRRR